MVLPFYLMHIFLPIILLIVGLFCESRINTSLPNCLSVHWFHGVWNPGFHSTFVMSLSMAFTISFPVPQYSDRSEGSVIAIGEFFIKIRKASQSKSRIIEQWTKLILGKQPSIDGRYK